MLNVARGTQEGVATASSRMGTEAPEGTPIRVAFEQLSNVLMFLHEAIIGTHCEASNLFERINPVISNLKVLEPGVFENFTEADYPGSSQFTAHIYKLVEQVRSEIASVRDLENRLRLAKGQVEL